jgi:hypothetical protein
MCQSENINIHTWLSMRLTVMDVLRRKSRTVYIDLDETIADLKVKVESVLNIRVAKQRLLFQSTILCANQTVRQTQLTNDCTVMVEITIKRGKRKGKHV